MAIIYRTLSVAYQHDVILSDTRVGCAGRKKLLEAPTNDDAVKTQQSGLLVWIWGSVSGSAIYRNALIMRFIYCRDFRGAV